MKYYRDYVWKNGKPKGVSPCISGTSNSGICFKVVADPYYRRISVEKYEDGHFLAIVYDSALFDFRKLKLAEQAAWQKSVVSESEDRMMCEIRDQEDRLILIEEYFFVNLVCRECRTSSPHGVLLSVQKMMYEDFNDPYNGVVLHDREGRTVMYKRYQCDKTNNFGELIEECLDMTK